MLTMTLTMGLESIQVNYTNAFDQEKLNEGEEIYVKIPKHFEIDWTEDWILK